MPERAHDRLSRLLGLVPYLTRRPGTDLADVAAHFDVAAEQIVDDLELLFVTGRPGHMPDDLIEAEWEGGRVYVGNADEVSVPVRLSPHEVGGLLLALDYLESAHEADPTTIRSVREKLQRASGENSGGMLDISPPRLPEELAETVRGALHGGPHSTSATTCPPATNSRSAPSVRCGCGWAASGIWTPTASPPAAIARSPSTGSVRRPLRRPPLPAPSRTVTSTPRPLPPSPRSRTPAPPEPRSPRRRDERGSASLCGPSPRGSLMRSTRSPPAGPVTTMSTVQARSHSSSRAWVVRGRCVC